MASPGLGISKKIINFQEASTELASTPASTFVAPRFKQNIVTIFDDKTAST